MNENVLEGKKAVIEEISTKINDAESVVVFEYQGLSVSEFETLRTQLREENVDIKVYKNRLAKLAIEKTGHEAMGSELVGPNAIAFSNDDAVAGARIISKFAKDHDSIKIKTGIVEGNVVEVDVINELASLPSRDGLLSMLLSCLQAPARDTAMIVDAVAKKVEETGVETAKEIIEK
ncbi:large subunit ribosomal protein L10 [Bacilli bacterium PM5-3]|nr:large subunit ribosomal protein L10 [Bacilli bacterium PM5-3]MDH6603400.1 large subunit ribosomal protein L10 [Bacilli bacterium PM5-9]